MFCGFPAPGMGQQVGSEKEGKTQWQWDAIHNASTHRDFAKSNADLFDDTLERNYSMKMKDNTHFIVYQQNGVFWTITCPLHA